MKKEIRKIVLYIFVLFSLSGFLGCEAKTSEKETELQNQVQELNAQNEKLLADYTELRKAYQSFAQANDELTELLASYEAKELYNNNISGCNKLIMEEIEYLMKELKAYPESFPIRDESIEAKYPQYYNHILVWFEELRSSSIRISSEEGKDCIFELIKIEKIPDTGTMQFDTPKEGAEFFRVYYLILNWDLNGTLSDINSLSSFHEGEAIMVYEYEGKWEVCVS